MSSYVNYPVYIKVQYNTQYNAQLVTNLAKNWVKIVRKHGEAITLHVKAFKGVF